jgi:hypothetical protein
MWRGETATCHCVAINFEDSIYRASGSASPLFTTFSSRGLTGRRQRSACSGSSRARCVRRFWHRWSWRLCLCVHLEKHKVADAMIEANQSFKKRRPLAHISLTPKNITTMNLPLAAGVYSYRRQSQQLRYKRSGMLLSDLKNEDKFLLIDSVPYTGKRVIEKGPRLFKIIFPRTIAYSSAEVESEIGEFLTNLSFTLRKPPLHNNKINQAISLKLESPYSYTCSG